MIEPRGWTTAAFCPMAGRGPTPEPPLPVVVVVVLVVVVVYCFKAAPSRITSALLSERESERGVFQPMGAKVSDLSNKILKMLVCDLS